MSAHAHSAIRCLIKLAMHGESDLWCLRLVQFEAHMQAKGSSMRGARMGRIQARNSSVRVATLRSPGTSPWVSEIGIGTH